MITQMTRRATPRMIRIAPPIITKVVHAAIFYRWFLTIKPYAAWRRPPRIGFACALSAH
jgi:hypothetical protein